MHDATPRLPNWPPPDGSECHERYPGTETGRSSITVKQLASWCGPTPAMPGLSIGCVWCRWGGGRLAMVNVLIGQEGRLLLQPGMNMR